MNRGIHKPWDIVTKGILNQYGQHVEGTLNDEGQLKQGQHENKDQMTKEDIIHWENLSREHKNYQALVLRDNLRRDN